MGRRGGPTDLRNHEVKRELLHPSIHVPSSTCNPLYSLLFSSPMPSPLGLLAASIVAGLIASSPLHWLCIVSPSTGMSYYCSIDWYLLATE